MRWGSAAGDGDGAGMCFVVGMCQVGPLAVLPVGASCQDVLATVHHGSAGLATSEVYLVFHRCVVVDLLHVHGYVWLHGACIPVQ